MVAGAIYEDVPSVRLPDSNGTFHPFTDTSDTTAVAADVAQGKTFHLADGTLATGTASGGGGGGDDYHPAAINDGNTYFYIEILSEKLKTVPMTMRMASGSILITWGDGSAPESFIASQTTTITHQYADLGRYVIKIEPSDSNSYFVLGGGSNATTVFGTGTVSSFTTSTSLLPYAIEIGTNGVADSTISNFAFAYCINLRKVILFNDAVGDSSFANCTALDDIVFPSQMSRIGFNAFNSATSLKSLTIPRGITTINTPCQNMANLLECTYMDNTKITGRVLSNNFLLEKFVVPEAVDSIDAYGIVNPTSLKELHFQTATPPTAVANSFRNFPTSCTIYVPQGSLSAYTSAANYPSASTYTYVEE
jgi:hypothetical protein